MPELYIITGSNGAGKSTIGPDYLPEYIRNNYQRELFPSKTRSPKEAKRLAFKFVTEKFDALVEQSLQENDNFVYEGHFTNDATWETPKRFKSAGYKIHLLFFGLSDPDLSQLRVTDRVYEGGHYVDRITIEANFQGNLEKLNEYYYLFNSLKIIDTSDLNHIPLASISLGIKEFAVSYDKLPWWFIRYMPDIASLLK